MHDGIVNPEVLYFRDETRLRVIGYLNTENNRECISENPQHLLEYPLHENESWRPVRSYIKLGTLSKVTFICTVFQFPFHETGTWHTEIKKMLRVMIIHCIDFYCVLQPFQCLSVLNPWRLNGYRQEMQMDFVVHTLGSGRVWRPGRSTGFVQTIVGKLKNFDLEFPFLVVIHICDGRQQTVEKLCIGIQHVSKSCSGFNVVKFFVHLITVFQLLLSGLILLLYHRMTLVNNSLFTFLRMELFTSRSKPIWSDQVRQ